MEHRLVAGRILQAIGGEENIVGLAHCATRLRIVVKDSEAIDRSALEADPDLKGTFEAGGMFQIIVGPGDVNIVFDQLQQQTAADIAVSTDRLKDLAAQSGNRFTRAIKVLADIFLPLIPILVGGGLLMAINNVLTAENLFAEKSVIEMYPAWEGFAGLINNLAAAPFVFLPVLVGFTATKRFGGNEFLGAGIGMAMVMPDLVNGYDVAKTLESGDMQYWDIFGFQVAQAGYQGSVLPILVIAWVLASLEKFFHRHLKGTVDFLLTPVLTLLITGFITFMALGPVLRTLGDALAVGLANLYDFSGPIGGFLFGLVYAPIVITGLHQSFPPIETMLWNQGGSFIFAIASISNIAQGAVALAVYFLARTEKLKGLSGAAGASALFGISEPALFGVNLRLRWPFYIALISAGIGGALISFFGVVAMALGSAGVIGFVSIKGSVVGQFLLVSAITFALAFVAAYVFGRYLIKKKGSIDPDEVEMPAGGFPDAAEQRNDQPKISPDAFVVRSPLAGAPVALGEVSDAIFAAGKLGDGVAIEPSIGKLVSPIDGTIMVTFPTKHAVAVRGHDGEGNKIDILMHIGFDTVNLQGEHFHSNVAKGDEVHAGDVLVEFDIAAIKAAGYPLTTPVVVSNSKKTGAVIPTEAFFGAGEIEFGAKIMSVNPKETAEAELKSSSDA